MSNDNSLHKLRKELAVISTKKRHSDNLVNKLFVRVIGSCGLSSDQEQLLYSSVEEVGLYRTVASLKDSSKFHESSAYDFFRQAQLASLLSKYPFALSDVNPMVKTIDRFNRAELLCKLSNKRFRYFRTVRCSRILKREHFADLIDRARRKIHAVLGPVPSFEEIVRRSSHGPGSSIGTSGCKVTRYYKYDLSSYTVSSGAYQYALGAILHSPIWLRSLNGLTPFCHGPSTPERAVEKLTVCNHNKVTFVPKTADTLRSIAVEPLMNIYLQKGVGKAIRQRLRRDGLDLTDSWKKNQSLALEGSVLDNYATVDLSMASDTISVELVRELLPPDWFDLLNSLRCTHGLKDKQLFRWEKFSSNGNGFTFELETLIFRAIAMAQREITAPNDKLDIVVFGDDIICSNSFSAQLCISLHHCGFITNYDKTYHHGPFRESCGKDYFKGHNVRPIFIKRKLETDRDLIFLLNSLRSVKDLWASSGFDSLCTWLNRQLHPTVRKHLVGPCKGSSEVNTYSGSVSNDEFDSDPDRHDSFRIVENLAEEQSALVKWCRHEQRWRFPRIIDKPITFTGNYMARYLQFIDGTREGNDGMLKPATFSTPGGEVVRRGMVTIKVCMS